MGNWKYAKRYPNFIFELSNSLANVHVIRKHFFDKVFHVPNFTAMWFTNLGKYLDMETFTPCSLNVLKYLLKGLWTNYSTTHCMVGCQSLYSWQSRLPLWLCDDRTDLVLHDDVGLNPETEGRRRITVLNLFSALYGFFCSWSDFRQVIENFD